MNDELSISGHEFCSYCGAPMHRRENAGYGDLIVWDCSAKKTGFFGWLKDDWAKHDLRSLGYMSDRPRFDRHTGQRL